MPTSAARNAAKHAHKKHNARLDDTSISPLTFMSRYDNAHGSCPQTPQFTKAQRQRKKVEALFAELKNQIGLRRLAQALLRTKSAFPCGVSRRETHIPSLPP